MKSSAAHHQLATAQGSSVCYWSIPIMRVFDEHADPANGVEQEQAGACRPHGLPTSDYVSVFLPAAACCCRVAEHVFDYSSHYDHLMEAAQDMAEVRRPC